MKQTIFEIRQRAEELMREFSQIWQHSQYSEFVADLQKDPVFMMFIMALAYQANETENDLLRLKNEIWDDFERMLLPYEALHAIPATVLIKTAPRPDIAEVVVNENMVFNIDSAFQFIPLFKSKVLNLEITTIERLDGRRWKVGLKSPFPIKSLEGFSFGVRNQNFSTLTISEGNKRISLIRPWNFSELPFVKAFDSESMSFNHGEMYTPSMMPLDLFARQEIRLFWIEKYHTELFQEDKNKFELIFEFGGIDNDFVFDKTQLVLNPLVLVNASIQEATLTAKTPILRVGDTEDNLKNNTKQFLHLINPPLSKTNPDVEIEIRKVGGDRFNLAALHKMIGSIIDKYSSDFYAFQSLPNALSDNFVFNLKENLTRISSFINKESAQIIPGVYLMLKDRKTFQNDNFSLYVKYLTTNGGLVNESLQKEDIEFSINPFLSSSDTQVLSFSLGSDETNSEKVKKAILRYYLLSSNRIVTMADIRAFCYAHLLRFYDIPEELIKKIEIAHRLSNDKRGSGYEICIDIKLMQNNAIKKTLEDKIPAIELLFKKLLEARSVGIYPFRVTLLFE